MSDLSFRAACELTNLIRRREISSSELLEPAFDNWVRAAERFGNLDLIASLEDGGDLCTNLLRQSSLRALWRGLNQDF
jgi:hypothetical protein